jgi:uncharacterized DUF497 family protein
MLAMEEHVECQPAAVFEWDDHNVEHIARHGVTPEEAEDALGDPRRVGAGAYSTEDEQRWAAIGATQTGRVLVVIFTVRPNGPWVITARDATEREKRRYSRGRK